MSITAAVQPDAIDLLEADHQAMRSLFQGYRALATQQAPAGRRQALAEQICLQLAIHNRLEEELFYPVAREKLEDEEVLHETEGEHASARDLIGQVLMAKPVSALYDAKVLVLTDYAERHMSQERDEVFPRVRSAGLDLALMGRRLLERKQELQAVSEALREEAMVCVSA